MICDPRPNFTDVAKKFFSEELGLENMVLVAISADKSNADLALGRHG